jgi:hypothetical protein
MSQAPSILAIILAIWLALMDYAVLRPRRRAAGQVGPTLRFGEWVVYALFLLALAGMVVSSVLLLAVGLRMHGWMLIVHMTLAPLFSICVTALALLWANTPGRFSTGERVAFWVVVASSFVNIATAMLSMMTWFGSVGQETLLDLHRWSGLLLMVAAAVQATQLLARGSTTPPESSAPPASTPAA